MDKVKSVKKEVLEEKLNEVIEGTFWDIVDMKEFSRPKEIYLYNSDQAYLVGLVVKLGLKFKAYENN